jgi:hypothetical protein
MGGRNPFLGIAYIVVGGICIIMGALFTATHLIKPRLAKVDYGSLFSTNYGIENLAIIPTSLGTKKQLEGRLVEVPGLSKRARYDIISFCYFKNA